MLTTSKQGGPRCEFEAKIITLLVTSKSCSEHFILKASDVLFHLIPHSPNVNLPMDQYVARYQARMWLYPTETWLSVYSLTQDTGNHLP